jgi:hypothetical protein
MRWEGERREGLVRRKEILHKHNSFTIRSTSFERSEDCTVIAD